MALIGCTLGTYFDIAEELAKKKKTISPKVGTPISLLCASTFIPNTSEVKDRETYGENLRIMEEFNRDKEDRISTHTDVTNSTVDAIAPGIRNQLHVFRNVVNPTIKDLLDKINYDLQNISNQPISTMEVIEWDLPTPYYNDKLEDLSSRYSEHGTVEVNLTDIAELPSSTEILELFTTGISSLDDDINKWLAGMDENYLPNLWKKVFMSSESLLRVMLDKDLGQANALATYLMAEKLVTHEPLNCFKVNRATFTSRLGAIRDFAGKYVFNNIKKNKEQIEKNVLIINIIKDKTYVHSVVYNEWLNNGGSVEILLGNMLSNNRITYGKLLLDNAQSLINKWNSYYAIEKQVRTNLQISNIRQSIEKNFITQINEARIKIRKNESCDIPSLEECDNIEKLFKQEVNRYGGFNINDLPKAVTRLVCRSRFYKTNAETFLTMLNNIINDNPELPIFEASTVATINYISEWVLTQVELK